MTATDVGRLHVRIAELHRELAAAHEQLGASLADAKTPEVSEQVLSLQEAAAFMGEPAETFRRRLEYLKAKVSRPGEHRQRYSRRALERVLADRLAGKGGG